MERTTRRLARYGQRHFLDHLNELTSEFRGRLPTGIDEETVGLFSTDLVASESKTQKPDIGSSKTLFPRSLMVPTLLLLVGVLAWALFFFPDWSADPIPPTGSPVFEQFAKPAKIGVYANELPESRQAGAHIGDPNLAKVHAPWPVPEADLIVYRKAYILGFSRSNKLARWVLYLVTPGDKGHAAQKLNDPDIPNTLKNEDYVGTNLERGSLILPSHVRGHDRDVFRETRYWSLIAPQTKAVRGKLLSQASQTLQYATGRREVWVMRGPVYDQPVRDRIGGVPVPTRYFYLVIRDDGDSLRTEAYLYPNEDNIDDLDAYQTTVEKIEEAAGLKIIDRPDQDLR